MDEHERKLRALAGKDARDDARTMGRSHLRKKVASGFSLLNAEYVLAPSEGKHALVKSYNNLLGSPPVQRDFQREPLKTFLRLHAVVTDSNESHDWQLAAANEFLHKYHLAFPDEDPFHVRGTKTRHCLVNLMSTQPLRNNREAFLIACRNKLGLEFRNELRGKEKEAKHKWVRVDLLPKGSTATQRRKGFIHICCNDNF